MSILEKARAYAAANALPTGKRPKVTAEQWSEWVTAAIELRSTDMWVDHLGQPQPMTWEEIARWIQKEHPIACMYKVSTLTAKLCSRTKRFLKQSKTNEA